MSITVYLHEERLRRSEGFKSIDRRSSDDTPYKEYHLDDERIGYSDGRWELYISDSMEVLPEPLKGLATGFSLYQSFPLKPARERGSYRYRTATAELEYEDFGKGTKNHVKVKGRELSHVQKLLRLIKAGEIRPEVSYEGPQSGLSRKDLEAKLEQVQDSLRDINAAYDVTLAVERLHVQRFDQLKALTKQLRKVKWLFCFRKAIVNKIDSILFGCE